MIVSVLAARDVAPRQFVPRMAGLAVGMLLFLWGFGEVAEVYANLYARAEGTLPSLTLKLSSVLLLMALPATRFLKGRYPPPARVVHW